MPQEGLIATRRPVPDTLFGGRLAGAYLLDLEVAHISDPVPHVRVLTVRSSDLVGFEYEPGQDLMIEFPSEGRSVRRRYTIRRVDPVGGTADLEFELHPGNGVAARWAARANIGDRLEAIGPRGSMVLREEARSHVFVADDSAMPAAFAMLEALPAHVPATAFFVTEHGPRSRPGPTGVEARQVWTSGTELAAAVADGNLLTHGPVGAYVIGERRLVRLATELLVATGIDPSAIATKAYWRSDQPNAAHGEPSGV